MNPKLYLGLGILTSFILLSTVSKPRQIEAFREQTTLLPRRSHTLDFSIAPLNGEAVSTNTNGIVLDQGSQGIRVGTADVIIYTNSLERTRITNNGHLLVSTTQDASALNNNGQINPLNVGGNITLSGNTMLSKGSNSFSSYFSAKNGYYDMGGMTVMDRSLDSGSTTLILGEWIQYQLAYPITVNSYSICPVQNLGHNGNKNIPSSFQLVASNDGILWTLLDTKINQQTSFNGNPNYINYVINNTMLYSYYRLIFTQLSASSSTTYGPTIELCSWTLFDTQNNYYPPVMTQNTQLFGSNTYTLSSSIPIGHTFSYINGTIQSASSNLVGLTQNPSPGSISLTSYYIFSYPYTNDIYTKNSTNWIPSGKTYTISLLSSTPYNSAVLLKSIYQGSAPLECMRVIYGPNGPQVGIGNTLPSSTLSVNGTISSLYSAFNAGYSALAKSTSNTNSVEVNSGILSGNGYGSILFHSVDSTGTNNANAYDAGLYCTGGISGIDGKGSFSVVSNSFSCQSSMVSFPTGMVGVGTTSPVSLFHVHSGNAMISNGTNIFDNGGELDFNTADTASYKPMSAIKGKYISSNANTLENAGGIGFFTRPSNTSNTNQPLVESLTIYHNGNVGIGTTQPTYGFTVNNTPCFAVGNYGYYTGTDATNCSRLWYSAGIGGMIDYNTSFQIRANNSSSTFTSYTINLTCLPTGSVGIGSTNPGEYTLGRSTCYGLDISYASASTDFINVLRLSNVSSTTTNKEVGMEFVLADSANNKKSQARISSKSSDSNNVSSGQLDLYVKVSDTISDSKDLRIRSSVTTTGLTVGNLTEDIKLGLLVANHQGSSNIGVAGSTKDWSADAQAGDTIISTNGTKNLILQAGSGYSAIYVQSNNMVGIGTSNPSSQIDVYYPYSNNVTGQPGDGINKYRYFYAHSNNTINGNITASVYAPSAQISGGNILTGVNNATTVYGASMIVEGASLPYTSSQSTVPGSIKFYVNTDASSLSANNPIVQIGNPSYSTSQTYTYFQNNSSNLSTSGGIISSYALLANGNVLVSSGYSFIAFSDQRIKKNIEPLSADESLNKIMKLTPCSYEMRDPEHSGKKIGVIAQEIKEIIPEAIQNQGSQYVANILSIVERIESTTTDTLLYLASEPTYQPEAGQWIRLVKDNGEHKEVQVLQHVSNNQWLVSEKIENGQWIVYGTKEEDLLAVDKDMISMVAVSAIQGLYHKYQSLEKRLEDIEKMFKR